MREITTTTTIYKFDELSEVSQETAIRNEIEYLVSIDWTSEEYVPDYVQKAIERAEELQTPWFIGQLIYEYGEDIIALDLQEKEYYKDGTISDLI